jgi:hypothetical protein
MKPNTMKTRRLSFWRPRLDQHRLAVGQVNGPWAGALAGGGLYRFTDTNAVGQPKRFYRLRVH